MGLYNIFLPNQLLIIMTKLQLIEAVLAKADITINTSTHDLVVKYAMKCKKIALELGYAQVNKEHYNPANVIAIVAIWTHGIRIDNYVPTSVEDRRIAWI